VPYLVVREPGRVTFTVDVGASCALGRDPENDIVVRDRLVSRRHLRIARGEHGYTVADLSSTHGVFVNGARTAEHALRDGDQLQAGRVILVFRDGGRPDAGAVFSATANPGSRSRAGSPEELQLALLFDVSRAIGALSDADELVGRLLDGVLVAAGGAGGVVGLVERPDAPIRRVARGRVEPVLSTPLLEGLLGRRESVRWRSEDGAPVMAAPLVAGGRSLGFIAVAGTAPSFGEAQLEFLSALAHLAAAALEQGREQRRLGRVNEALKEGVPELEMIGECEPMRRLRARIERVAASDAAVLIRGESGTGKELVARTLHALSGRAEQPFVAVNCAAIPDSLIESELFGHEKGAFTGALKRRRGKFALAHQGTLFLDEVGDLSAAAQAKVLRAIEEGEVQPVGAEEVLAVDARIVSATHQPLEDAIAAGRFRSDLFYRLNLVELQVPALRERGEDVVLLATAFLERAARRLGVRVDGFAPGALDLLRRYRWPGNVRQLVNEIERALLLGEGTLVDFEDLRQQLPAEDGGGQPAAGSIAEAERLAISRALAANDGNLMATARALGIARATLYRKLRRYGLATE
jgi:Nif-specific regulatory protein